MKHFYLKTIVLLLFTIITTTKALSWTREFNNGLYYEVYYSGGWRNYAHVTYESMVDDSNYNMTFGTIDIPASLRYYDGRQNSSYDVRVNGVARMAFHHCPATSILLPNSILSIDDNAFSYCKNLKSITIPGSVITIGEYNQEIKGETNVEIIPVIA